MTGPAVREARRFRAHARAEIRSLTGDDAQRARQERLAVELLVAPLGIATALPLVAPIVIAVRRALSEKHQRWLQ